MFRQLCKCVCYLPQVQEQLPELKLRTKHSDGFGIEGRLSPD